MLSILLSLVIHHNLRVAIIHTFNITLTFTLALALSLKYFYCSKGISNVNSLIFTVSIIKQC